MLRIPAMITTIALCGALLPAGVFAADDLDLAIDAERLAVLLSRASDAADLVLSNGSDQSGTGKCDTLRADRALKGAVLEMMLLRNKLAVRRELLPAEISKIKWPTWAFEIPQDCVSAQGINRRLDWLWQYVPRITDPVCAAAEAETDDHLVCSVE